MGDSCFCAEEADTPVTVVFLRVIEGDMEAATPRQLDLLRGFFGRARHIAETRQGEGKMLHVKIVGHQTCIVVVAEALVAVRLAAELQQVFTSTFPQHISHTMHCQIGIHSGSTVVGRSREEEQALVCMSPAGVGCCDSRYRPVAIVAARVSSMEASSTILLTDATVKQLTDGERYALYVNEVGNYLVRVDGHRMYHTIYSISTREAARRSTTLFSYEDVFQFSEARDGQPTLDASLQFSSVVSPQYAETPQQNHPIDPSATNTDPYNPEQPRLIQQQRHSEHRSDS